MGAPDSGLCAACAHQRLVRTGRGSRFSLCERAFSDPRYPKYPPLPVMRCRGFTPRAEPPPAEGRPGA